MILTGLWDSRDQIIRVNLVISEILDLPEFFFFWFGDRSKSSVYLTCPVYQADQLYYTRLQTDRQNGPRRFCRYADHTEPVKKGNERDSFPPKKNKKKGRDFPVIMRGFESKEPDLIHMFWDHSRPVHIEQFINYMGPSPNYHSYK